MTRPIPITYVPGYRRADGEIRLLAGTDLVRNDALFDTLDSAKTWVGAHGYGRYLDVIYFEVRPIEHHPAAP